MRRKNRVFLVAPLYLFWGLSGVSVPPAWASIGEKVFVQAQKEPLLHDVTKEVTKRATKDVTTVSAKALPTLGDAARGDLSPAMERKLGIQIMHQIRQDADFLDDGPTNEYLNKLGQSLLEKRPDARGEDHYEFEFFAIRNPVLNAFALPGGHIGVHSGLLLTVQTESELAGVMGHEIGHVSQRHIARMLGQQKQDALLPLAALLLAVVAAKSNPDAAMAVMMGGQGLAISRQLSFSRDAEREADRIGFQILKEGGFDVQGMYRFFGRMQHASRHYTDSGKSYLSTHPVTSERMADIQGRLLNERYKQRSDGLDFYLAQARVRVLQQTNPNDLKDVVTIFDNQIQNGNEETRLSAQYGWAFAAYKQGQYSEAEKKLSELVKQIEKSPQQKKWLQENTSFATLAIEIEMGKRDYVKAGEMAEKAMRDFPWSRAMSYGYAQVLYEAKQSQKAEAFLREQIDLYRSDAKLHFLLAQHYAQLNKQALQHIELARGYALQGAIPAAVAQLDIARDEKDVTHYDLSVIDALQRDWKEQHQEWLEEEKKREKAA